MNVVETSTSLYPSLRISKKALNQNLAVIQGLIPEKTQILIPVKANAYGCGLPQMIPFFREKGIDYLGVANPREGIELRGMGWENSILNLGGFFPEHAGVFCQYDLEASITDLWQVRALEEKARSVVRKTGVHIKLDLGMGRIGIKPGDVEELVAQLRQTEYLEVRGIFTHFPKSDQSKDPSTDFIVNGFQEVAGHIQAALEISDENILLHAANSYGILHHPSSHLDMVRPGLIFYGYFQTWEDWQELHDKFPIQPALELAAHPISLRKMEEGETISYGSTFSVPSDNYPVGVIPLGYADGIPRALSNRIEFQGHPLLGRVTMDQIVLGGLSSEKEILLLGEGSPPLEKWADLCNTISYEIMTGFGARLRRVLV